MSIGTKTVDLCNIMEFFLFRPTHPQSRSAAERLRFREQRNWVRGLWSAVREEARECKMVADCPREKLSLAAKRFIAVKHSAILTSPVAMKYLVRITGSPGILKPKPLENSQTIRNSATA
jgi:hypothetical protein